MSAKIRIKAVHQLEFSCPGCPDKSTYDVTIYCGADSDLPEKTLQFQERHKACLERIDAAEAEKNRVAAEASRPMPAKATA